MTGLSAELDRVRDEIDETPEQNRERRVMYFALT